MGKIGALLSIASTVCLAGCGLPWFADPKTNPAIQETIRASDGPVAGIIATTAERRVVLTSLSGSNAGRFCAEPPPDTAENIASSFAAELAAKGGNGAVSAELAGQLADSLSTTVKNLTHRSQGIILFRDAMYNLCQSTLNGNISREEFGKKYDDLLTRSIELISLELNLTAGDIGPKKTAGADTTGPAASSASTQNAKATASVAAAAAAQAAVANAGGNADQVKQAASTAAEVANQAVESGVPKPVAAQLGAKVGTAPVAGPVAANAAGAAAAGATATTPIGASTADAAKKAADETVKSLRGLVQGK